MKLYLCVFLNYRYIYMDLCITYLRDIIFINNYQEKETKEVLSILFHRVQHRQQRGKFVLQNSLENGV